MDKHEWMKGRFSIGCSLADMSLPQWKSIIDKYHPYLYDIYFSPPTNISRFQSRQRLIEEFERPEARKNLYEALNYAKDKGVKLELALNTHVLNEVRHENDIRAQIQDIKDHVEIDSSVTMNNLVDIIKDEYPDIKLVYAYNNMVKTKKDVDAARDEFDEIVVANSAIRNFKLFSHIKSKGKRVRWMPNNGCSFACAICTGGEMCTTTYNNSLKRMTPENVYALQSIMPWELHEYYAGHPDIDVVKLSTRPSHAMNLRMTLKSYIFNMNQHELMAQEGITDPGDLRYLWGRMGEFVRHDADFNFDRINEYKKEIWRKMGK